MPASVIANPWTPYGLSDDPFFQAPLTPGEDAPRPISLFVGREREMQLLGGQIVGSASSRAVVQGLPGVGKTSFVNRLKAALAEPPRGRDGERGTERAGPPAPSSGLSLPPVLMHELPVRVVPGMTPRQFCAEVLRVLLQIRGTVASATADSAGDRPRSGVRAATRALRADLVSNLAPDHEADFWRRVGRIVEGEDGVAAGVTVGPVGAQRERTRIPAEVTDLSLIDDVVRAIALLARGADAGESASGRATARRVLVHINNLENLSRADAQHAAGLFQDVRDVFLAEHGHWLFVGAGDLEHTVFRTSAQLGGIVPFAVTLGPLAPEEVAELLERRYAHLRRGRTLTRPVQPEVAAAIYRRYHGDLRNFLRLLSRAVQHHAITAPGQSMDAETLVQTMAPLYWPDLVRHVGQADAEHLAAVLAGAADDAEFRVADVAARAGITQASASKLVQRLATAGAIAQARSVGKSVYYRVAVGDLSIALGLTSAPTQGRSAAREF